MDIRNISISDYTYTLPEDRIATHALPERDASRLLIVKNGRIAEDIYRNIDAHLPAGSLLLFNNTRVVEARLLFRKPSGGVIEIFCLEPGDAYKSIPAGMQQQGRVEWKCLIGGASKWKPGQVLQLTLLNGSAPVVLEARYLEKLSDSFLVELRWTPAELSFAELLHMAGNIPLPPYIKRPAQAEDKLRYQTIYAKEDGSVAAPTAGLHFTQTVFEKLAHKNITTAFLTLHVGAGTFKPVKSETMAGHDMHAEYLEVSKSLLQQLLEFKNHIIAVGTTAARTLESLYWFGVKILNGMDADAETIQLGQWELYEALEPLAVTFEQALQALLDWMEKNNRNRLLGKTQLLIAPGYEFRIINGLVTNFHQPASTLLLLVAALVGHQWREIYNYALENDFRFLSYGDGCLIMRAEPSVQPAAYQ